MLSVDVTCEPDIIKAVIMALSDSGAHLDHASTLRQVTVSYLASILVMQGKVAASHSPMRTRTITRT